MTKPLQPRGEALRRAIRWLSDQPDRGSATIDRAAARFDLSPLDTQFLVDMFVHGAGAPGRGDGDSDAQ